MNLSLRIALIIALVVYYAYIYCMLKKKKLFLKYSLLWIFAGLVMLIFVLFPNLLEQIAGWIGIINYLNGLYAAILFGLLILLMYLTTVVSELSQKSRVLVQELALLEERVRKLEKQENGGTGQDA